MDARHVSAQLHGSHETVEQVAFADPIVLNKTNLVDEAALQLVTHALRRINPLAPSVRALRSDVTLDRVLGLGGFDLDRIKRWSPTS